jgi:uncharacterized protein (TIGR00661 family)
MKILYGVNGEGMGHAIRSAVVRDHLTSRGHSVQFASSKGRALSYLSKYGPVARVPGFSWTTTGKFDPGFLTRNALNAGGIALSPLYLASIDRPDVVISDFEPCVARYAKTFGIPLLSIGNIEFLSHCSHNISTGDRAAAALAFPVANRMVPGAHHYFVTSFAHAPLRKKNVSIHFPILRPEILNMARQGVGEDAVVVYFNDKAPWRNIVAALQAVPDAAFHAYGSPAKRVATLGNVTLFPMSDGFMSDLIHSRAVVGGAGFTLATECIYSGKPLLALPFANHFEQILSANYLEALGFGQRCRELTPERLRKFLSQADSYRANLSKIVHDRNAGLFSALDRMLS